MLGVCEASAHDRHRHADYAGAGDVAFAVATERDGSRVKIALRGEQWHCHHPHPGKEAKRYQVEEARELLERVGVKP